MFQLEHAVGRVESEGDRVVDASIVRDDQLGGEGTCFQPRTHRLEHSGRDGRALVVGWYYDRQCNQDPLSPNGTTRSDWPDDTYRVRPLIASGRNRSKRSARPPGTNPPHNPGVRAP